MSTLSVATIKSQAALTAPVFRDSANTEIGQLCKAWVNFNGTGTVAIRASFNVSSITDNGTGDYTVNFTNALADANYGVFGMSGSLMQITTLLAGSARVLTTVSTVGSAVDYATATLGIFR